MRHAGVIAMTALRLDGTRLVTVGGEDKMVRIWDPVSGQETSRMPRGKTRVFSPDGTVLATGGDRVTRLLDTATGRQLAAIEHDDLVRSRTFSPDGSQLAIRAGKAAYRWAM
jgi:WD40 repeat protein